MSGTAIEALLRRDRIVVIAALAVVAMLSWSYVLWLAGDMSTMPAPPMAEAPAMKMGTMPSDTPMADMEMGAATQPGFRSWTASDLAFTFAMWAVMMVGMMTPSVAPMVLLHAGVGRRAREASSPFASTAWFFAGYLLVWTGFSVVATAVQWLLTTLALLSAQVSISSTVLGGAVLMVAGFYQFTTLKGACLRQCQTPMAFLANHGGFRAEPIGALRLGAHHGVYCLGCCWALMALLFVGGVMNVLWIGGIAILILLEKTVPSQRWVPRITGVLLVAAGVWTLVGAV